MSLRHALARCAAAALFVSFAGPLQPGENSAPGQSWWKHVEALAGDEMQGRAAGSPGHRMAAAYVAGEFERAGLRPAGTSSYFQQVPLRTAKIIESQSRVALLRNGVEEVLELGGDVLLSANSDPPGELPAPAVFVGYGLVVPEMSLNDLAGVDLNGKIAVFLQGAPASLPAPLRAHYQSHRERWRALRAAGAVGFASIPDPKAMDMPWERMVLARSAPTLTLAGEQFLDAPGLRLVFTVNPASAGKLFAGSGRTLAEILSLAAAGKPLPAFPLACTIRARVAVERSEAVSENVIGLLAGADRKLSQEYVLLTAHLDHLGVGAPVGGDSIYNGAMDNAAGVASIIEIARRLAASPPRRSVIFAAVTAEEHGLLGSEYFAALPTVPLEAIVANINLDMFLPLHKLTVLHVYGLQESTIGPSVWQEARKFRLRVVGDPEPERNLFIRSDQYSFIRRGIPSIYLKFGYLKGSPEEKLQNEWLRERYHSPFDDARRPVDVVVAARFNRLVEDLTRNLANARQRPRWLPGSFFRRFTQRAA